MNIMPLLVLLSLALAACANPGSGIWHARRMGTIERLYRDGRISYFEYVQLKNQVDHVRAARSNSTSEAPPIVPADSNYPFEANLSQEANAR